MQSIAQATEGLKELTEAEAAAELRISVKSLRRERAAGKIEFAQRRRRVFYPVDCIEQYRQSQVTRACPIVLTSVGMGRSRTGTSSGRKTAVRSAGRRALRITS